MPRFPATKNNIRSLGALIAKASLDKKYQESFKKHTVSHLAEIKLPEETTSLFNFKIIEESSTKKIVVIPFRLNQSKLDNLNQSYIETILENTAPNKNYPKFN